jgi:hypothetical protein
MLKDVNKIVGDTINHFFIKKVFWVREKPTFPAGNSNKIISCIDDSMQPFHRGQTCILGGKYS